MMYRSKTALALAAILAAVMLCCLGGAEGSAREKVILDCDMGYMNDDTLALSMLLRGEARGGYEVIGITLEGGNTFIDAEFETDGALQTCGWNNTRDFLESIDCENISVYRGTDYPTGFNDESISKLTAYFENTDYLPFNDGYGAIHAFERTTSGSLCDSNDAADFMIKAVRENPGSVVIIAIGPTMNIANAIKRDSSFAENVKAIYYMGGALGECFETETTKGNKVKAIAGANVTPYAEYNALYDPSALYTCITAGFARQYITPAELCVEFDGRVVEALKANAANNSIADRWVRHYEESLPEYPYWDPVTAFAYLRPEFVVEADERYMTVNTDRSDERFGETVAIDADEYRGLPDQDKSRYGRITVIHSVEKFWDEAIRLLCSEN